MWVLNPSGRPPTDAHLYDPLRPLRYSRTHAPLMSSVAPGGAECVLSLSATVVEHLRGAARNFVFDRQHTWYRNRAVRSVIVGVLLRCTHSHTLASDARFRYACSYGSHQVPSGMVLWDERGEHVATTHRQKTTVVMRFKAL